MKLKFSIKEENLHESKENRDNIFVIFLKGILMGIADVIPGVSGGTIAFITGIYKRLVNGIINVSAFLYGLPGFFTKREKISFKKIDFGLFIPLLMGIWTAIFVSSKYILSLMQNYPGAVYSFFVGLIFASACLIYRKTESKNSWNYLFLALGVIAGFSISALNPSTGLSAPGYPYLFLMGAIAVCAMILPGVSGAYLLLLFGQYEFMLSVISNLDEMWFHAVVFSI
ncbi:MAG TPA: DUF368 domain-containing protein, partial [Acidobacteriota bacterium]|nr:DUF368 domain-containing protein [Acidobacteriota bacterium]